MEMFPDFVHYHLKSYNYIHCVTTLSQDHVKEFYPIHSI
jgi:hypothetical protein